MLKFPNGWGQTFAATAAAGAVGLGAYAMGGNDTKSRFIEDRTTRSAIAEAIAPNLASTVGQFDALAKRGEAFTASEAAMKEKLDARYSDIRAAAPDQNAHDGLDAYYGYGYETIAGGHLGKEDASLNAVVVLAADNMLTSYAEIGKEHLVDLGLSSESADIAFGGLVATELMHKRLGRDATAEGFVSDSPYGAKVKSGLAAQIGNISAAVEMLHRDISDTQLAAESNGYATWERGQGAVMKSLGNTERRRDFASPIPEDTARPKARGDDPDRMIRIAAAAQAKREREIAAPTESLRPEARPERADLTDRIRQRVEMKVAAKRPTIRPSRDDDRDI